MTVSELRKKLGISKNQLVEYQGDLVDILEVSGNRVYLQRVETGKMLVVHVLQMYEEFMEF